MCIVLRTVRLIFNRPGVAGAVLQSPGGWGGNAYPQNVDKIRVFFTPPLGAPLFLASEMPYDTNPLNQVGETYGLYVGVSYS